VRVIRFLVSFGLVTSGVSLLPLAAASADPTGEATSSVGSSAGPAASSSASPSSSAPATTGASSAPASTGSPSAGPASASTSSASSAPSSASTAQRAVGAPDVELTEGPPAVVIHSQQTFTYKASAGGARFRCRMEGPSITPTWRECGAGTSGSITYPTIAGRYFQPSRTRYRFTVQAFIGGSVTEPTVVGTPVFRSWRLFSVYSPDHYKPRSGATFNRPLGNDTDRRTNLRRVIKTINSMPGYKEAYPSLCPSDASLWPSRIKVTLYSMTDERFRAAAVAANRRCVSVEVLMNNHLNRKNDPAWRKLEDALHTRIHTPSGGIHRSFARRCNYGCRGSGVLHTKMYLFDSNLPDDRYNKIKKTVMVGSSNMTQNAAGVQWNDLYARVNHEQLYGEYSHVFSLMRTLKHHAQLLQYSTDDGTFRSTFWPKGSSPDPMTRILSSVRCSGVTGGTGSGGHTVIYINMHAWFNSRGLKIADQVRALYGRGCRVHVLYSFMSYGVYKKLLKNTRSGLSVRRTLFSNNGHTASVYSHYKNILISGHYGSNTAAWLSYTGSNNFTNEGTHFDEVQLRIKSRAVYGQYRNEFNYMVHRKSAGTYANFSEPSGGGRVPKQIQVTAGVSGQLVWSTVPGGHGAAVAGGAPSGTPTITSDAVTVDAHGVPHAVD
jgi:phosphatidylserine/phosphatidylglycerophosphate/cardiolipin synthase-like enzyme